MEVFSLLSSCRHTEFASLGALASFGHSLFGLVRFGSVNRSADRSADRSEGILDQWKKKKLIRICEH